MIDEFNYPILAELVSRATKRGFGLGKIQIQKLIYFLKVIGVPLDYDFQIYHYGPYCFELADDINRLGMLGVLNITPDSEGYGYHIKPGEYSEGYLEVVKDLTKPFDDELKRIIESFAKYNATELELFATIHYAKEILEENEVNFTKNDIITSVYALKPKFNKSEIERRYDVLEVILPFP